MRSSVRAEEVQELQKGQMANFSGYSITFYCLVAIADMEALLEEVSKMLVAYASAIESNR
jgi:hypothetical protein